MAIAFVAALAVAADIAPAPGRLDLDDATLADVEAYLEASRSELGIPGMAAGLVWGNEAVLVRGFGEAHPDGAPVRPDTPFLIASLSKSITAMALIQLVETGQVGLDAPVSSYLPELSPSGDVVTVRDLMHHRSGLTTYTGNEPHVGVLGSSLQANVERLGPLFEPSAPFMYSNANYDAMALIVERVSGVVFADYIHQRVFDPLEMTQSFVDASLAAEAGLAQGHYRWLFLGYRPHTPPMPPGLAGSYSMFSSAQDLTHFLIAHLNGGTYGESEVVGRPSISLLHRPSPYDSDPRVGYAGGLGVDRSFPPHVSEELSDLTTLWHSGSSASYESVMWLMPEVGVGFVLVSNAHDSANEGRIGQVAQGVKYLLFGLEPPAVTSQSPPLVRWGKHLILVVVVAQASWAIAAGMSADRYLSRRRPPSRTWALLATATVIDFIALAGLLWIIPSVAEAPLRGVLDAPDYRILIFGMAAGLVWGVIRTTLIVVGLFRRRSPPTAEEDGTATVPV